MRDLRIIFMGTPDFAVAILKHLIVNKYQVVGVITAPDKAAGRGRKINDTSPRDPCLPITTMAIRHYLSQNKMRSVLPMSHMRTLAWHCKDESAKMCSLHPLREHEL